MILNGTSDYLYDIEQTCRDVSSVTNNMCTVLSVFDLCKGPKRIYAEMNRQAAKMADGAYDGISKETQLGVSYYQMIGAESVPTADSILAREMLERCQVAG